MRRDHVGPSVRDAVEDGVGADGGDTLPAPGAGLVRPPIRPNGSGGPNLGDAVVFLLRVDAGQRLCEAHDLGDQPVHGPGRSGVGDGRGDRFGSGRARRPAGGLHFVASGVGQGVVGRAEELIGHDRRGDGGQIEWQAAKQIQLKLWGREHRFQDMRQRV
jgi:hypothetical protein